MSKNRGFGVLARNRAICPDGVYHIINRAPGNELLFLEEGDNLRMLSLFKKIAKKFEWKVFCFCLMPNHVHFLVKIKNTNLSEGSKNLFERYAMYFNKKYQRKGVVFSKPFRASFCHDTSYLLSASLYIHLNPLKANLEKQVGQYRWTSLDLYINEGFIRSFIDYSFILRSLNTDVLQAKKIYQNLLGESARSQFSFFSQNSNALRDFRLELMKLHSKLQSFFKSEAHVWLLGKKIEEYNTCRSQQKPHDPKAILYLMAQLQANGYTVSEIAKLLGVSRQHLYNLTK